MKCVSTDFYNLKLFFDLLVEDSHTETRWNILMWSKISKEFTQYSYEFYFLKCKIIGLLNSGLYKKKLGDFLIRQIDRLIMFGKQVHGVQIKMEDQHNAFL